MEWRFASDPLQMNWLRPDFEYARVTCPPSLTARVTHRCTDEQLDTEIVITNMTDAPVMTSRTAIGIQLPLEDRYDSSAVCMLNRCHAHVFCGHEISYVCALRMGGAAPHLGLVLTEGSLCGYSIQRDLKRISNDRGCFILHPSPAEILPGDSLRIAWTIFPHEGKEDFFRKVSLYRPFVRVTAQRYVLFPGEESRIEIAPSFSSASVEVDGMPVLPDENGRYFHTYRAPAAFTGSACREVRLPVCVDGVRTFVRLLCHAHPDALADARCRRIAEKQQYRGADEHLRGAYLPYDNEEERICYDAENDYNAGRERVGMGMLMARYLQRHKDPLLAKSLAAYAAFVRRELVNEDTGLVTNDYRYNDQYKRAYNYPWYAAFYTELYALSHDSHHLLVAFRILKKFYAEGGTQHYSIELPAYSLWHALDAAGLHAERDELERLLRRHAQVIMERGYDYPPFEVNYEQSIVAPAAWILLQAYQITGEKPYLEAAGKQLAVLEFFNGMQPDAYLHETAIRHWDGYWFGKYRLYGDTFPHYWSGLSGSCFALYGHFTQDASWLEKAEHSWRGVLPLIFPDGSASCAHVFPETVNGVRANLFDPCANDQDWGLYFYLRAHG